MLFRLFVWYVWNADFLGLGDLVIGCFMDSRWDGADSDLDQREGKAVIG